MTEAERIKFNALVEAVERVAERVDKLEKPMIYNYIDDNMPEWARESVKWCADNGIITGTGDGLGLDSKDLKWCTIAKRLAERSEKQ